MYTQEQILDMYFDRNQQAVSATTQMYGASYPVCRHYGST